MQDVFKSPCPHLETKWRNVLHCAPLQRLTDKSLVEVQAVQLLSDPCQDACLEDCTLQDVMKGHVFL